VSDHSMATPGEGRFGRGETTRPHDVNKRWYWLLLVPLVGVLIPPIYNSASPELIGIPFFYWYQMVWIPISVLCTVVVYRKTRGDR
jgi:Protein of unknown function (DUF3311)